MKYVYKLLHEISVGLQGIVLGFVFIVVVAKISDFLIGLVGTTIFTVSCFCICFVSCFFALSMIAKINK